MKNLCLTIVLFFSVSFAHSQWSYENISNDFDDPYRIAYTTVNNSAFLKLENVKGRIVFYIQGGYYCDESPIVDLVFILNGVNVKYSITGFTSESSEAIFLTADLMNNEMLDSFKKCSTLKVRVNESYCDNEIYTFNMSKSSSALNYIINE
tara:strand:+ start:683 stop:1135 length:453 start_codon:yes stop_codon:yes gene_type:complete